MNGLNNTPTDFRDMPVNSGIQNSTVPGWVYYLSAYRGYFQNFYASSQGGGLSSNVRQTKSEYFWL